MRKFMLGTIGAAMLLTATAGVAQQSSYKAGPMWTASRIQVEDGQFENYMDYLTKTWVDNQAFAKKQGWLLDYHILDNINARDGEPTIVLLTSFRDMPSAAESERRAAVMQKRMQQDDHSADAASGERGKMRKLMGSVLYRELVKR